MKNPDGWIDCPLCGHELAVTMQKRAGTLQTFARRNVWSHLRSVHSYFFQIEPVMVAELCDLSANHIHGLPKLPGNMKWTTSMRESGDTPRIRRYWRLFLYREWSHD